MRLIDADMLLKEIENIYSQAWAGRDFADIVQQQPTINAKPVKHGTWTAKVHSRMKWIPEESDGITEDEIEVEDMTEQKCSICQRWTIKFTHHIELDFCPLCGARMDDDKT